jgi:hypothetical protein
MAGPGRPAEGKGYNVTFSEDRGNDLGYSLRRLLRDAPARDKRIRELWMACWTQGEIAEAVDAPRESVRDVLAKLEDVQNSPKPAEAAYAESTWKPPSCGRCALRRPGSALPRDASPSRFRVPANAPLHRAR